MKFFKFQNLEEGEHSFRIIGRLCLLAAALFINLCLTSYLYWHLRNSVNMPGGELQNLDTLIMAACLLSLIFVLVTLLVSIRNLGNSLSSLMRTLNNVLKGELDARSGLTELDDLGSVGTTLDIILDERVKIEQRSKKENEDLSNAVVKLLHAVYKLSQKDLTARVEVAEDATAPIADSLNLLADEIANVLQGVRTISNDISSSCQSVKNHSDMALELANKEGLEVDCANSELLAAAEAMKQIAELAQTCNIAAGEAIRTTSTAKDTVIGTVEGINTIRETIRETEKRIKRLGERSQEISSVVSLINSIAERTHILALNASMHAASAGEAGRGFAVVADEVQRLAENAREATAQISSLVNNIQTETSDAVTTMNSAISEVVSGTKLAEKAGEQMQETMRQTNNLVQMVQQIAASSMEQAKTTTAITERVNTIKESTVKTNTELHEQSANADKLVDYSAELVKAVGVFKLPSPTNEKIVATVS